MIIINRGAGMVRKIVYLLVTMVAILGVNQVIAIGHSVPWGNWWTMWRMQILEARDWSSKTFGIKEEMQVKIVDQYLKDHDSPMVGSGRDFIKWAQEYNLPVYLMPAMAGWESGFGKYGYAAEGTYNAVGLGIHEQRRYNSWAEGIEDMALVLRKYYFDEGLDDPWKIQNKWAPRGIDGNGWDDSWAEGVNGFIHEMQGMEREMNG